MRKTKVHPERILVVEDNVSMLLLIQKAIFKVRPNAEIFSAVSLEEAFTILIKNADIEEKNPYELIIADIFLEGAHTGLDLWRVLRSTYPQIPILVVSSLSEEKVLESLLEPEKKDLIFFKKPFMINELYMKIKEVLEKYPQHEFDETPVGYKPDSTLISSDQQLKHLAHLMMLKLSLDWLIKQDWVDSPYGGQNPVQDLLFETRFMAERFWEDYFFRGDKNLSAKEAKLKEQILRISELTPELKEFFTERLTTMENFFHEPESQIDTSLS